jgi:hypothetical protein
MDDAEAVQMAQTVGDLIQHSRHIAFTSLGQGTISMGLLDDIRKRRLTQLESDVEEGSTLLLGVVADDWLGLAGALMPDGRYKRVKLTIRMIVALTEKSSLLAGDFIELYQHALDSHVTAVPFSGEDDRTVASRAQLFGFVDFEGTHLDDMTRHLIAGVANSDDVWFELGFTDQTFCLVDDLLDCLLDVVAARLRRVTLLLIASLAVLDTTATSAMSLLLLGFCRGGLSSAVSWWIGCRFSWWWGSLRCRI